MTSESSPTEGGNAPDDLSNHPYASLVRNPDASNSNMDSVSLLTGLYGTRGERIRHVAYTGALQLPAQVLAIISSQPEDSSGTTKSAPTASAASSSKQTPKNTYQLPTLDSVKRPSVAQPTISTTKVVAEVVAMVDATTGQNRYVSRTRAWNHTVDTAPSDPARIRGGAGEDQTNNLPGNAAPPVADAASIAPTDVNPYATNNNNPSSTAPGSSQANAPSAGAPAAPVPPTPSVSAPSAAVAPNTQAPVPPAATNPVAPPPYAPPAPTGVVPPQPSATASPAVPSGEATTTTRSAPSASASAPPTTSSVEQPTSSSPKKEEAATTEKQEKPFDDNNGPVIIKGLDTTPSSQWEQHKPSPADEMPIDPAAQTPKPEWFQADDVSDVERAALPEWFDGSARHRTAESYLKARNKVMQMATAMGTKFVTATLVRRSIPGDAGSLLRLHEFLTTHTLINEEATNDSAPTPQALLGDAASVLLWNDDKDQRLIQVAVEQARQRQAQTSNVEGENNAGPPSLDWESIAEQVGMSANQCEQRFLTLPSSAFAAPAGSVTPDVTTSEKDDTHNETDDQNKTSTPSLVQDLVTGVDPSVVHAVVEAALQQTSNLADAQKAALAGLQLTDVAKQAQTAQGALAQVVSHTVDLRMQKLEHRLALLDDVEGLLEAERVALELERRDLYTARCRHWFGGP